MSEHDQLTRLQVDLSLALEFYKDSGRQTQIFLDANSYAHALLGFYNFFPTANGKQLSGQDFDNQAVLIGAIAQAGIYTTSILPPHQLELEDILRKASELLPHPLNHVKVVDEVVASLKHAGAISDDIEYKVEGETIQLALDAVGASGTHEDWADFVKICAFSEKTWRQRLSDLRRDESHLKLYPSRNLPPEAFLDNDVFRVAISKLHSPKLQLTSANVNDALALAMLARLVASFNEGAPSAIPLFCCHDSSNFRKLAKRVGADSQIGSNYLTLRGQACGLSSDLPCMVLPSFLELLFAISAEESRALSRNSAGDEVEPGRPTAIQARFNAVSEALKGVQASGKWYSRAARRATEMPKPTESARELLLWFGLCHSRWAKGVASNGEYRLSVTITFQADEVDAGLQQLTRNLNVLNVLSVTSRWLANRYANVPKSLYRVSHEVMLCALGVDPSYCSTVIEVLDKLLHSKGDAEVSRSLDSVLEVFMRCLADESGSESAVDYASVLIVLWMARPQGESSRLFEATGYWDIVNQLLSNARAKYGRKFILDSAWLDSLSFVFAWHHYQHCSEDTDARPRAFTDLTTYFQALQQRWRNQFPPNSLAATSIPASSEQMFRIGFTAASSALRFSELSAKMPATALPVHSSILRDVLLCPDEKLLQTSLEIAGVLLDVCNESALADRPDCFLITLNHIVFALGKSCQSDQERELQLFARVREFEEAKRVHGSRWLWHYNDSLAWGFLRLSIFARLRGDDKNGDTWLMSAWRLIDEAHGTAPKTALISDLHRGIQEETSLRLGVKDAELGH